ncbi:MAG: valine--tRNA ligase [Synergistaceae bacterium]|jgi:valyl-tRNA synthetase|nr:valine--tRNA ligase [Synergistaceae bacterium]
MEHAAKGLEALTKSYDPKPIEDKWYAKWIEDGIFKADPESGKPPFSIVIPPPNVTGSLHLGHALDNTLQDILCRAKRMQGFSVLWMPGTDHAGIATQNVVERALREEGSSRHELGREAFVYRVWRWKEEYGSRIIGQLKKLGASCDWDRERFTMDEGLSHAVRRVFAELYDKDLIYRGKYLINWCPRCLTALSDLEVEHRELSGKFYSVRYAFSDGDGGLTVMTTRPETILGDTAIAVHPRDEKNRHLIGRRVIVPIAGRVIPVIEDNMVDPEFGTGAVKITPAHDPNDFLVGQRHGLEAIQVIDGCGDMNENAGKYAGLGRFEARAALTEDLRAQGLLLEETERVHSVGHCYRCGTVVEPYLSEQWFVRTRPLADEGVRAVNAGEIRFIPDQWTATYHQWMENVRDWCISRQLWWGHRIPAWYCGDCGETIVSAETPCACKCGSTNLRQDEDVLDTWFSSALWPFSTMGWPDDTPELRKYYPTSVLVTAFDIIFFWVARMIMMGMEFMRQPPFRDVYIHALVRDEHGQKMSKSKGNVIDPLDIIDKFGADALRLTLAALTLQGRDIFLSEGRIEQYRFFLNKLWNASRFALMNLEDALENPESLVRDRGAALRVHDRWILARLSDVAGEMTRLIDGYFFGESAHVMYDFVWGELCDWYLELSKPALRGDEGLDRKRAAQSVLYVVFRDVLKLLHPIIPFVTEELWSAFGYGGGTIIGRGSWPDPSELYDISDAGSSKDDMDCLQAVIRAMRNLRAEIKVPPQRPVPMMSLRLKDERGNALISENRDMISLMARVESVELEKYGAPKPPRSISRLTAEWDLFLPVGDLLDVGREVARLGNELEKLVSEMGRINSKLGNKNFIERAPAEVVEKEREALAACESRRRRIEENIEGLTSN